MSIESLLQKLLARGQSQERDAQAAFHRLARTIATGREPKLEEVEQTLQAADRGPEDLARAVETVRRREAARAAVKAGAAARPAAEKASRAIALADAEFQELLQKQQETLFTLEDQLQEARRLTDAGARARQELLDTCDDPAVLARQRANQERRKQALHRRGRLQGEARQAQELLDEIRSKADVPELAAVRVRGRGPTEEAAAEKAARDAEVRELEGVLGQQRRDLAAVEAELAACDAEARQIEEDMLAA